MLSLLLMSIKRLSSFLLTAVITLSSLSFAIGQTGVSSPYSRYGLGNLNEPSFHRNLGMGGLSFAIRSSEAINIANPASYSAFRQRTFVFDVGTESQGMKLSNSDTRIPLA